MSEATKPSEVLSAAADLIEPEGAWTQGEFGRRADGSYTMLPSLREAVCFCAEGAIGRAAGIRDIAELGASEALIFMERFVSPGTPWAVSGWNDAPDRTQAEVVAALRAAAELAKAEGQ